MISNGIAVCTVANVNTAIPLENTENRKIYAVSTIPLSRMLSPYILRPAGLLLPLFLPQDTVNALSDLLGFRFLPQKERFR